MRTQSFIAACLSCVLCASVAAQKPSELIQRVQSADANSALDAPDLKPWHLKLSVQLFDDKGKPTDQGTIEEWWKSDGSDRREYSTNAYKATEIRAGGKLYRSKDVPSPPYLLELLREQVVHPVSHSDLDGQLRPEIRRDPFGKVQLECVMLSQTLKQFGAIPLGLFPTYCFDVGQDALRASFQFGEQFVLRNALGAFEGRHVATRVIVTTGTIPEAKADVEKLEVLSAADFETRISPDLIEREAHPVELSSGTVAGMALDQPTPNYPLSARQQRESGTVVLHAILGADGHIHALKLVSTPGADLAISAIAAVRRWKYKPYLVEGVPVDVETTINVNYTFGPR